VHCSKLLISAGVRKIIYDVAYPDPIAQELLAEAGVGLTPFAALEGLRS
jgi:dCMP deaminase